MYVGMHWMYICIRCRFLCTTYWMYVCMQYVLDVGMYVVRIGCKYVCILFCL